MLVFRTDPVCVLHWRLYSGLSQSVSVCHAHQSVCLVVLVFRPDPVIVLHWRLYLGLSQSVSVCHAYVSRCAGLQDRPSLRASLETVFRSFTVCQSVAADLPRSCAWLISILGSQVSLTTAQSVPETLPSRRAAAHPVAGCHGVLEKVTGVLDRKGQCFG